MKSSKNTPDTTGAPSKKPRRRTKDIITLLLALLAWPLTRHAKKLKRGENPNAEDH